MTAVLIVLAVVAYLLIGYAWAMLYIHKLTDGRWAHESVFNPGVYYYTPMGVGTALTFTIVWPFSMVAVIIILILSLIGELFSKDMWRRLYRIKE